MMTTTTMDPATTLPDTLRALVDARLDTIDRMLLGRVARQDRLAIVREVESQVFDLLAGGNAEALDRDDVLAVLARLDPPEAYLPEEPADGPRLARRPAAPEALRPSGGPHARLGLASGVLGMVSVLMVFVSTSIVLMDGAFGSTALAYVMVFGSIGLTFILGLLAVVLAARARLRGGWSVVGLVTGTGSLLISAIGGIVILTMVVR